LPEVYGFGVSSSLDVPPSRGEDQLHERTLRLKTMPGRSTPRRFGRPGRDDYHDADEGCRFEPGHSAVLCGEISYTSGRFGGDHEGALDPTPVWPPGA
jgi:hypothetical protein